MTGSHQPAPDHSEASTLPSDTPPISSLGPILPDGEGILQPPMDNTPNDAPDPDSVPARIPHLGHVLLFAALGGSIFLIVQLTLLGITQSRHINSNDIPAHYLLASEAFTWLATLTAAWFIFPPLWQRSFATGIQLNPPAAARNALKLIPIGITLSYIVQAVSSLITMPKSIPMDDFFRTPSDVWLITAFGTLLAPFFEEIVFRGFLLPAIAIAYDWLSLPRTEAARSTWNSSNRISSPALLFSAILTSTLFAAIHGKQTDFTWPVLLLLFGVSLILTAIRLRLRSVLASTVVHASYNFAVFLTAFIATGGYRHLDRLTH